MLPSTLISCSNCTRAPDSPLVTRYSPYRYSVFERNYACDRDSGTIKRRVQSSNRSAAFPIVGTILEEGGEWSECGLLCSCWCFAWV